MTAAHPLAPALRIVDVMRPSGTNAEATTKVLVLSGWDETTSAATEPWALLQLTGPDDAGRWSHRVHQLRAADTGGWEDRVRAMCDAGPRGGTGRRAVLARDRQRRCMGDHPARARGNRRP